MSEDTENKEHQPKNAEIIQLNQEFLVFTDVKPQIKTADGQQVETFTKRFQLQILDLPPIDINLAADIPEEDPEEPNLIKKKGICPFKPEAGYWITDEDFKIDTRKAKLRAMGIEADHPISQDVAPLQFDAITQVDSSSPLRPSEPNPKYPQLLEFKPEIDSVLQRLRLQVYFYKPFSNPPKNISGTPPKEQLVSAYESTEGSNDDQLYFYEFYPLDSGPLASDHEYDNEQKMGYREGLRLYLPSDPTVLVLTKARFVLAPLKEPIQPNDNPNL